jgi:GMP synthase (glutamine-hydrolysing)
LTGGPASVYDQGAPRADAALFDAGVPVLGICYGMQLLAHQLGGEVERAQRREYGRAELEVAADGAGDLFAGLPRRLEVWMSHGDRVVRLPPGFLALARTANAPLAAAADPRRSLYGVQFHPEVVHTPLGQKVLENFLYRICGLKPAWTMASFVAESVEAIRRQVGPEGRVICALSGGVDSTVTATLVGRAIGDRLTCIFVDHGLLRLGEAGCVVETFRGHGPKVVHVDAAGRFLERLAGVVDPEEKRRRVGEEFIRVFEEEARKLGRVEYLAQGTIYPDVIESGTATAATIKTHHNVGGLPGRMELKLVEPLRELFKDEVRRVGEELGLPADMVWRQPFPGPGLAVRIVGEVTSERVDILQRADAIITGEIERAGLGREIWQYFGVLLALRTVGVMGDERSYAYPVVMRCVVSDDAMTADWARLPPEVMERIAARVVNEVPHVNRLVYDLTTKPPATIEWE